LGFQKNNNESSGVIKVEVSWLSEKTLVLVVLVAYILLLEWPDLGNYDGSFILCLFINTCA
jgi:hypothetical protein